MNTLSAREMGWDEDMGQSKRRTLVLERCRHSPLKAARVMENTAKYSSDNEVRRKAKQDATYFFHLHERQRGK